MWGLFGCCFVSAENVLLSWACQTHCICLCLCLAMASARLAAGISQNGDRTRCLSGRRVAIVTMSASLRCFWETIPHPNQPVWVSAAGRSSFFFSPFPNSLPVVPSFPLLCLFSSSSAVWRKREVKPQVLTYFSTVWWGEIWIQTHFHVLKFTPTHTAPP